MTRDEIWQIYDQHYNPSVAFNLDLAQCPVESWGKEMYLYDEQGRAFLDFAGGFGVFSIGHANESVQLMAQNQLGVLAASPSGLYSQPAADLMFTLAKLLPDALQYMIFAVSGSEAIERAIQISFLARPNRIRLIAATNSYHGTTLGALGITGQDNLRLPFGPLWSTVQFVPYGDVDAMVEAIGNGATAVFLEPILGGGFLTVPPRGYLTEIRKVCDLTHTLLVIDEVQTGFGRTGTMFAFEYDGIVPDIMIVSKAITGGHTPMAATIINERVYHEIGFKESHDPFSYNSRLLSYPMPYAVASASIDFIVTNRLPERAAEMGKYMSQQLLELSQEYPELVLEMPGRGLMLGVKLRNNTVENALWMQLFKRGVIGGISATSKAKNPVMRLFPPLTVKQNDIKIAIGALTESLKELRSKPSLLYDLANLVLKAQYLLPKRLLYLGAQFLR